MDDNTKLPFFQIEPFINKLKTQSPCNNASSIASCGNLEIKSESSNDSKYKNDIPYKFHIIHVKANSGFNDKFKVLEGIGDIKNIFTPKHTTKSKQSQLWWRL
jgi:hypothetical protein